MYKNIFIAVLFSIVSFQIYAVDVTQDDIDEAKKQIMQEEKSRKIYNKQRAHSKYEKVTDKSLENKLNEEAGLPKGTEWVKATGNAWEKSKTGHYKTSEESHKFTDKYKNTDEATKSMIDREVEIQKERKAKHDANPNKNAVEILDKEMNQSDKSRIEEEAERQSIINTRARKIAEKKALKKAAPVTKSTPAPASPPKQKREIYNDIRFEPMDRELKDYILNERFNDA